MGLLEWQSPKKKHIKVIEFSSQFPGLSPNRKTVEEAEALSCQAAP